MDILKSCLLGAAVSAISSVVLFTLVYFALCIESASFNLADADACSRHAYSLTAFLASMTGGFIVALFVSVVSKD